MKRLLAAVAIFATLTGCGLMGSNDATHDVRFEAIGATSAYVLYGYDAVMSYDSTALPWEATINDIASGAEVQLEAVCVDQDEECTINVFIDGDLVETQTSSTPLVRFEL